MRLLGFYIIAMSLIPIIWFLYEMGSNISTAPFVLEMAVTVGPTVPGGIQDVLLILGTIVVIPILLVTGIVLISVGQRTAKQHGIASKINTEFSDEDLSILKNPGFIFFAIVVLIVFFANLDKFF